VLIRIDLISRHSLRAGYATSAAARNMPAYRIQSHTRHKSAQVVAGYKDPGISGAKGRDQRPGLDLMLTDASRRKFDVVMSWAIDRLGRSLIDLLGTIQHLESCGVDLYLDQQNIDTTTLAGKLMFQITGAFAEFERSMIRTRVNAGLRRAKDEIKRKGHFVTKHGEVRKRLGRPSADPDKLRKSRAELAKGIGINKVAKAVGLGVGTVSKLKNEMAEAREAA
jgi:DNA invertase Pin-like site-specific DNA recombinase